MASLTPIDHARIYMQREDHGKAFSLYLMAKLGEEESGNSNSQHHDSVVDSEFLTCAREWFTTLSKRGKIKEMFSCLETSMSVFSENNIRTAILLAAGSPLFDQNWLYEAMHVFNSAMYESPKSLSALECCERVKNAAVSRWHFRMLNDKYRNERYYEAVKKMFHERNPNNVIDIGCGTGLLSMFCSLHNRSQTKIYGCESSRIFHDISLKVLSENQMTERVNIVNKYSTELEEDVDYCKKFDAAVMEIFDCGLLGEGVLPTIMNALKTLMCSNIPISSKDDSSNVICQQTSQLINDVSASRLISSTVVSNSSSTNNDSYLTDCKLNYPINTKPIIIPCKASVYAAFIECDELRTHFSITDSICGLTFNNIQVHSFSNIDSVDREPYHSEFMSQVRGGFQFLSDPVRIIDFDFEDIQDLQQKVNSSSVFEIPVKASGSLDAAITWYKLQLYSDIFIETSLSADTCWEQAIYNVTKENGKLSQVLPGDIVSLECKCQERFIQLEVTKIKPISPARYQMASEDDMATMSNKESSVKARNSSHKDPILLHPTLIRRFNDEHYHRKYNLAIQQVFSATSNLHAMCLCGRYSLIPVLAARQGKLTLADITPKEFETLKVICTENGIAVEKIQNVKEEMIIVEPKSLDDVSLVIFELVDPCGLLKDNILNDIELIRRCLLSNHAMIPCGFSVRGKLISSEFLRKNTSVVSDEVTMGFKVKDFMNQYQVTTFQDIDLLTLEHKVLSDEVELISHSFSNPKQESKKDDDPADLLNSERIEVTCAGQLTALVYWFDINLTDSIVVTTKPDAKTHWRQSAIMLPTDIVVHRGDEFKLSVVIHASNIHIKIEKDGHEVT